MVAIFVSPRDPAITSERKIIRLLKHAHPEMAATAPSRIQRVRLADGVTLIPEHAQIAEGYTLKLHVRSSDFTIEAEPVQPGKTGTFSFFRDKAGVIRWNPELGQPAGEQSRRWGPKDP